MKTRHQRGYIFKQSDSWYLRYYVTEIRDGIPVRQQRAHRLVHAGGEYKTKGAASQLAEQFLAPLNAGAEASAITVKAFVEDQYLPWVEQNKRPSTFSGYRNLWLGSLISHFSYIQVRSFRTSDGERVLAAIAEPGDLTVTTLRHIKAFLSGVFRYAKRQGVLLNENPIRDVVIPRGKTAGETYAYSLPQILEMLELLGEPAATIVAAAAFTGARRGELRGFCWEDYKDGQIAICRSYWRRHLQEPKTLKSKANVPVVAQLAERLERHRQSCGNPHSGPIFAVNLDSLARDVIKPALAKAKLQWHGWHAFRRGLATNLHHLGVQDKVIQRILRHANVSVTQASYIKAIDADVQRAMEQLAAEVH